MAEADEAVTLGAADDETTETGTLGPCADRGAHSVGEVVDRHLHGTVDLRQTAVVGEEAETHTAAEEIYMCRTEAQLCVVGDEQTTDGQGGHDRLRSRGRGHGPLTPARRGPDRGVSARVLAGLNQDLEVRFHDGAVLHPRETVASGREVHSSRDAVVAADLYRRTEYLLRGSGVGTRRLAAGHGLCPARRQSRRVNTLAARIHGHGLRDVHLRAVEQV